MEIKIKEIENKEIWENFLLGCEEKTFLQSWNWGEFQKMIGNKIWRFGVFEERKFISLTLLIKIIAKRGTFLFLPHGPCIESKFENKKLEILEAILEEIKKIAKDEKAIFFRLNPIWKRNQQNIEIFKKLGFREAPIFLHPDLTWELDLRPSEEEILGQMRKTTRYLIKQAAGNPDIEIIRSQNIDHIDIFNKIYQETIDRQHFVPYSLDYLKNEFVAFNPDNQIIIFLGKYQKKVIASAMTIFWQNLAIYHQGATSFKHPKIPVSYLLQWESIKEAKKRGCQFYNFWGIAPENKPNHPWQGFTLFKTGFGGYKKEYVKTQDFPFSKKYWLTYLFEKIRKIKRGI